MPGRRLRPQCKRRSRLRRPDRIMNKTYWTVGYAAKLNPRSAAAIAVQHSAAYKPVPSDGAIPRRQIPNPRVIAMKSGFARNAIVLGLLSAIGPFAIDMYLPALPSISARPRRVDRGDADEPDGVLRRRRRRARSSTARSPTWSGASRRFISACRCSPWAAIGCALSPTIEWLIFFRFIQGIGACAGMVIPRAIVRDLHTGHRRGAADVADHAGVQRFADPGAADRQRIRGARQLALQSS